MQANELRELQEKANQGNKEELFKLGMHYLSQPGWQHSGKVYLEKAADKGHVEAAFQLANCLLQNQRNAKSTLSAVKWLRQSAIAGHAVAKQKLQPDGEAHLKLVTLASKPSNRLYGSDDSGRAAYELARLFNQGTIVPKDENKAFTYCKIAADKGCIGAYNSLGCFYDKRKDYTQAYRWFEKAAQSGQTIGYSNMAIMCEHGRGVEKNRDKAIDYHERSVRDYPRNNLKLARLYQARYQDKKKNSGWLYERDKRDAIDSYQKAIKTSNTANSAIESLGLFYLDERLYSEAKATFEQGTKKSISACHYQLALMYMQGLGVTSSNVIAAQELQKASNLNDLKACYKLACLYERGAGITKNTRKAFELLLQSKTLEESQKKLEDKKSEVGHYYAWYQTFTGLTMNEWFKEVTPYFVLEKALGYSFFNPHYCLKALNRCHDDLLGEAPFQKLEFLGDSILGTVIREWLVDSSETKDWRHGDLEYTYQKLVGNQTYLPKVGRRLKLETLIKRDISEQTNVITPKMLADAVEALIAAIFQDSKAEKKDHYSNAKALIKKHWSPYLTEELKQPPRSQQQELSAVQPQATLPLESPKEPKPTTVTLDPVSTTSPSSKSTKGPRAGLHQSLFDAAQRGDFETVKILVAQKANVNFQTKNKNTPLMVAAYGRHSQIVIFLLDNGANKTLKNKKGKTAYDMFLQKNTPLGQRLKVTSSTTNQLTTQPTTERPNATKQTVSNASPKPQASVNINNDYCRAVQAMIGTTLELQKFMDKHPKLDWNMRLGSNQRSPLFKWVEKYSRLSNGAKQKKIIENAVLMIEHGASLYIEDGKGLDVLGYAKQKNVTLPEKVLLAEKQHHENHNTCAPKLS